MKQSVDSARELHKVLSVALDQRQDPLHMRPILTKVVGADCKPKPDEWSAERHASVGIAELLDRRYGETRAGARDLKSLVECSRRC